MQRLVDLPSLYHRPRRLWALPETVESVFKVLLFDFPIVAEVLLQAANIMQLGYFLLSMLHAALQMGYGFFQLFYWVESLVRFSHCSFQGGGGNVWIFRFGSGLRSMRSTLLVVVSRLVRAHLRDRTSRRVFSRGEELRVAKVATGENLGGCMQAGLRIGLHIRTIKLMEDIKS